MQAIDEKVDFIIVGSGGGALCAALYLAIHNKKVLVLEKSAYVGGTTARSGGVMWIPNNQFLKRDGIADSFDQAALYLDSLCQDFEPVPGASEIRRHTYIREATAMVDFLVEHGIELDRAKNWPDYYDERPGGLACGRSVVAKPFNVNVLGKWKKRLRPGFLEMPVSLEEALVLPYFKRSSASMKILLKVVARVAWAILTGKRYASAGKALQARMLKAVLEAGADIRVESPVTQLIVENGKVLGVVVENQGKSVCIGASMGVLVGAGGFAHNTKMRQKYQPGTSPRWSSALTTDTGEMIQEMARHGAALAQMEEMVGNQCVLPPESSEGGIQFGAQMITAKPHAILVDQAGQRYMNESGSYMAYCKNMLAHNQTTPSLPSWAIFDSQFLEKYMLAGTMPGKKKPANWYQSGFLKQADSIEALAGQINIEPASLGASIDRFNGFARNGKDEDFLRGERAYDKWLGDSLRPDSPSLGEIEQAPFYAVAVYPGDVGTYGGVVTDEFARVMTVEGDLIDGLYASGVSTASVMGRAYPGAGASVGPSFTWGYVAAKHALKASVES
jgi:3-oxosteroid 1-dehydrogenase